MKKLIFICISLFNTVSSDEMQYIKKSLLASYEATIENIIINSIQDGRISYTTMTGDVREIDCMDAIKIRLLADKSLHVFDFNCNHNYRSRNYILDKMHLNVLFPNLQLVKDDKVIQLSEGFEFSINDNKGKGKLEFFESEMINDSLTIDTINSITIHDKSRFAGFIIGYLLGFVLISKSLMEEQSTGDPLVDGLLVAPMVGLQSIIYALFPGGIGAVVGLNTSRRYLLSEKEWRLETDNYIELWSKYYNVQNTTILDLSNNRLKGRIPTEIGSLTNLTSLKLRNNRLVGEIPQEVCDLIENNNLPISDILTGNNLINTCE